MKKPIITILLLIAITVAGVYAYKKINRPAAVTERSAEEENVKRIEQKTFVKPSEAELREQLTKMQYYVTQEDGTEYKFRNEIAGKTGTRCGTGNAVAAGAGC